MGLLVLVATLTAASTVSWPVGPLWPKTLLGTAGPPGSAASASSTTGTTSPPGSAASPENQSQGLAVASGGSSRDPAAGETGPGPVESVLAPEPAAPTTAPPSGLPEMIVHVVGRGETVSGIAARYGLKAGTVASSAGLDNPDRIYPGEILSFPSVDGVTHIVKAGDTLSALAAHYQVTTDVIAWANSIKNPKALSLGRTLIIPGGKAPRVVVTQTHAAAAASSSSVPAAVGGTLAWPFRGQISSYYGMRWGRLHSGLDIAAPSGTIIHAAAAGEVTFVGWYGQYGRCLIIDHGGGVSTLYGHTSAILVNTGDQVERGEAVAKVGSTGNSTGPHLHFEVRVDGQTENPLGYLGE